MKAPTRFADLVGRRCTSKFAALSIGMLVCASVSSPTHGESIVVEQGNQVTRTEQVRVNPGEQISIRNAGSKLDLTNFLVVDGGTVRLESGGKLNTNNTTGHSRLTEGGARAIVDGPDSVWTVGGYLEVGDSGEAHLMISGGGKVQSGLIPDHRSRVSGSGGAASTATITGAGSIWNVGSNLEIGDIGQAHLVISNGGKVLSGQDGERSRVSGAGGPSEAASTATIEGAGSLWTVGGDFAIGDSGEAHLLIRDGGRIESGGNGKVNRIVGGGGASEAATTATITGAGSTWITRGEFALGDNGVARLLIEAGGKLESGHNGGQTTIVGAGGEEGETPAAAVVTGRGSSWNVLGDFYIGRGTLDILDGGQMTSGTAYFEGLGTITISGPDSSWAIQGRYEMARNGPVTTRIANGGLLSVTGSIESRPGGVLLIDGGRVEAQTISSDVNIRGSGTIQSDVTSRGPIVIGSSAGVLTIGGDFTQTPTASLHLELAGRGGVVGVDFDRLVVQDIATLSGHIDVSLLGGFTPALGDSFELIRYGSLQFASPGGAQPELRLPSLAPDLAWQSNFGPQSLTISVQAIPEPASLMLAFIGFVIFFQGRRYMTARSD